MYVRITGAKIQLFGNDGKPAASYLVYTYKAGTSTPATTYFDRDLQPQHANTNPIVLNSRGEADIYVGEPVKLVFTAPGGDPGSPIWSVDYVGEQRADLLSGAAESGTQHNNYEVNVEPAPTSLSENLILTMTPDVDNSDTLVQQTFVGTGINDGVFYGPYVGQTSGSTFVVEIDSTGVPDTFKWRKDNESWVTGVPITTGLQSLKEGVKVQFSVNTGHTLGDKWVLTVETPARVNLNGLGNFIVYKNKGGSIVALDGSDMKAGYPAHLILNQSLNGWMLTNPATPVFTPTTIRAIRTRKIITGNYEVSFEDQGCEICYLGSSDITVTLPAAPNFAHRFFYLTSLGTGTVTVDAGSYWVVWPELAGGQQHTVAVKQRTLQFHSNSIDWHVLTINTSKGWMLRRDVFTSSGTWYRPANITAVWVMVVGGGGGGGGSYYAPSNWGAGGGGGGGATIWGLVWLGNETSVPITVGQGGAGGVRHSSPSPPPESYGQPGGTSSFGSYISCPGGGGGNPGRYNNPGTGGSGGTLPDPFTFYGNTTYFFPKYESGLDGSSGMSSPPHSGGDGGRSGDYRGQRGAGGAQNNNGQPGTIYGGGGGGGGGGNVGGNGGNGANGVVVVIY